LQETSTLLRYRGYSVEPKREITVVVSALDESVPDVLAVSEDRIWNVLLPSKKKHRFEAANAKEHDASLIFMDTVGDLVGKFRLSEVQGCSVEVEPSEEAAQVKVERLGRLAKSLTAVNKGGR
jgi:hypothetical protein